MKNAGSRLPKFMKQESTHVKGAVDFIALNQYATVRVKDSSNSLENDNVLFVLSGQMTPATLNDTTRIEFIFKLILDDAVR